MVANTIDMPVKPQKPKWGTNKKTSKLSEEKIKILPHKVRTLYYVGSLIFKIKLPQKMRIPFQDENTSQDEKTLQGYINNVKFHLKRWEYLTRWCYITR